MSTEIEELLEELKAYTTIYEKLEAVQGLKTLNDTFLSQSEIESINFLVYEKIYWILNEEPIYHIIANEWGEMKEDFIHYVLTDTKDLIKIIEYHLLEK